MKHARSSAYVHIPFCARRCPYCDFAVVVGRDETTDRYLASLLTEIEGAPTWRPLDSVYFGGGTPSRFGADRLGAVLTVLTRRFGLAPGAEVSLEANPEDLTPTVAAALVTAGFNRISFGVQSFDQAVLAALGRCHSPDQAVRAVSDARAAGFWSINLDLIFGTPGETLAGWQRTIETAVGLGPDHVSTYGLTVERGTELGRQVAAGAPAPDPDLTADMWELADAALTDAGLFRYEVSNAARSGHACRYNLGVWAQGEYLGFGLGAHSHRAGIRRRNLRRLDAYLDRVEGGVGAVQGWEKVHGWAAEQERLMLGLRRTAGVESGPGGDRLLASDAGRRLEAAGVITREGGRLLVRRPLLTDEAMRAVLALAPVDC